MKKKPKVLISINTTWNVFNFRSGLIKGLLSAGYEVVIAAPEDQYAKRVAALGVRFKSLPMDGGGTHPIKDTLLLLRYIQFFLKEKPDAYLGYTVKPNIYGGLAAQILKIPVINNIAGLGTVFIRNTWLTFLVRRLYKVSLSRSQKIFFQNNEDRTLFVESGLVDIRKTACLPGSGINLNHFLPVKLPSKKTVRFLLIARMLWDKGIGEFVDAAKKLKSQGSTAEFCLLGFLDSSNPSSISVAQMDTWVAEGSVQYLGVSDCVSEEIAKADCIVLPSYREGTPRSLLEAAAMARPIITTDVVGCRNVVDDGVNGFLCKSRNAMNLADKMAHFLSMPYADREAMGLRGREKMERQFDEKIVINKYLEALQKIV